MLQATGEDAEGSAAVGDLRVVMHLLARLTSAEPGLALTLVQMPVQPGTTGKGTPSGRAQDLLMLVAGIMSLLSQLFASPQNHVDALSLLGGRLHAPHMSCHSAWQGTS